MESKHDESWYRYIKFLYVLVLPFTLLLFSYLRIDFIGSLLLNSSDSHCEKPDEGFGIHCFGDFHEGLKNLPLNQLRNHYWLSPMDSLISLLSSSLSHLVGSQPVLAIFFLLYLLALLSPLIMAWRIPQKISTLSLLSLTFISSMPFLLAIDRMNNICLAAPILFLFFSNLTKGNFTKSVIFFVILVAIKPQFIIISIVYLTHFKFKHFLKAITFSGLAISAIVIPVHHFNLDSLRVYVITVFKWGSSSLPLNQDIPSNISFSRLIYYLFFRFSSNPPSDNSIQRISLVLSIMIIALVFAKRRRLNQDQVVFLLLTVSIFGISQVAYSYYLVAFIVFFLSLLTNGDIRFCLSRMISLNNRKGIFFLKSALALVVIPIPIPILGALLQLNRRDIGFYIVPILNPVLISFFVLVSALFILFERDGNDSDIPRLDNASIDSPQAFPQPKDQ